MMSQRNERNPLLKKLWPLLVMIFSFSQIACRSTIEIEYDRGVEANERRDHQKAVEHFKRVVQRAKISPLGVEAAYQVADIYFFELKDFALALSYYKHAMVNSQDKALQLEAQKKIADIVFNHAADYKGSVTEFSRLLELNPTPEEYRTYTLNIAKSYFYLRNFYQAQIEVEKLINKSNSTDSINFEPLQLKAHIAIAEKELDKAIEIYEGLLRDFPKRSQKDLIALNLAVCYEEQKDYDKAIAMLTDAKTYYPTPDFLQMKIERLKIRKTHLPGAQGFRK